MRVCEVTEFGGPEVLREAQRPWPNAAAGEIVVEIAATNINPTDIAARSGAHRRRIPDLEPPFVPDGTCRASSARSTPVTPASDPAIASSG